MLELEEAIQVTTTYTDSVATRLTATDFNALCMVILAARVLLKLSDAWREALANPPLGEV